MSSTYIEEAKNWGPREYRRMALDLVESGTEGDMNTRELIGYEYLINPYNPWFSLDERNLNIPFIYKELVWYLDGDMAATWIGEHAAVWKSVLDHDKRAVSNYGAEAFRHGRLRKVAQLLQEEPMTRRAIIYFGMNAYVKLHTDTKDQPCANSIHWMVREGVLHTIISQRSQDYIYGVSGDAVFMTLLTNIIAGYLDLDMAPMKVQVASFHHYPKHMNMVGKLLNSDGYHEPWPFSEMIDEKIAMDLMLGRPNMVRDMITEEAGLAD